MMNMLEKRKQLHQKLKMACNNVYFNPPANVKMQFPCIIYHSATTSSEFALNGRYLTAYSYRIEVLDTNADSPVVDKILNILQTADIVNAMIGDGINHTYLDYKTY